MNQSITNFVNGEMKESQSTRFSPVFNPATGEQINQVTLSKPDEVEEAIAAAHAAFPCMVCAFTIKTRENFI